jgi:hypothetical protein
MPSSTGHPPGAELVNIYTDVADTGPVATTATSNRVAAVTAAEHRRLTSH